jgi:CBS domain-containing protein
MLVREVMTSPAQTVTPETTVKEALRILDGHAITALPVVDEDGRPRGVVSEVDLICGALRADQRRHEIPLGADPDLPHLVAEVMNHHPISVTPDSDLAAAVDLMMSTAIKSLPVVQNGTVVGIVSRSDVVHALARGDDEISAEVDDLLRRVHRTWLVEVTDGGVVVDGPETDTEARLASAVAGTVPGVVSVEVRTRTSRTGTRRAT